MYAVIALYKIVSIENTTEEIKRWRSFLEEVGAMARIYLSEDGVNCQMSLPKELLPSFLDWLGEDERFADADVKVQWHHEHVFPRLTVKYREQLCALDCPVPFEKQAAHISPEEWDAMLAEGDEETVVLDVRNEYEWEVGHFEGALRPPVDSFRDFPTYLEELKERLNPETSRILMYCTGGIRCEFFSPLMKEAGFTNLYQLKGGVIRYGLERGQGKWRGNLFVFDDRLVIPVGEERGEAISHCQFCLKPSDQFYNCANMECNELFLSCPACAAERKGCCSEVCLETGKCRPFAPNADPKPFRRLPHDQKAAL
jgi:UPF0176 protein